MSIHQTHKLVCHLRVLEVMQLGSAFGSGPKSREFKSPLPDHFYSCARSSFCLGHEPIGTKRVTSRRIRSDSCHAGESVSRPDRRFNSGLPDHFSLCVRSSFLPVMALLKAASGWLSEGGR